MTKPNNPPPPPRSLKTRGRKLWISLNESLEWDAQEVALLLEVCRTLDTIDALAESIETEGVMVNGSQGQKVLNSAVAELRQQQAAYARLLPLLNVDEATTGAAIKSPKAASAARAAKVRWGAAGVRDSA